MVLRTILIIGFLLTAPLTSPVPYAGDSSIVRAGDLVDFHFTCRFQSGEVLVSSEESIAKDDSLKKDRIFIPRSDGKPVQLPAGVKDVSPIDPLDKAFEFTVASLLAEEIIGMIEGEKRHVELQPDSSRFKRNPEQILKIARVRTQPKQRLMTVEQFRDHIGKDPVLGQPFVIDPAFQGEVAAVAGNEVRIIFRAQPGSTIDTPYGKGTVQETEDQYHLAIDAIKGTLVRMGPYVGIITEVDDKRITIDYGLPFAGKALSCDVTVLGLSKTNPAAEGSGS